MNSFFTIVAILSTVAVALPLSTNVALEAIRHQAPRDSAIVIFAKDDGTLWIGMPAACNGTQLALDPNTLIDRATNKLLNVNPQTGAIQLSDSQNTKFTFVGDSLLYNGESKGIACPSTAGVQLFWGEESMCTNGTLVDLFQSQHILKERRSFFDNAEALVKGGEPKDASLFGLDFAKRSLDLYRHFKCGCDNSDRSRGSQPPCTIPHTYTMAPPCALSPPCGSSVCDGRCKECQCSRGKDKHCLCDKLRPAAWGSLFDCIVPDHCPSGCCCPAAQCSVKHHETDCRQPGCYCQDHRFYYPSQPRFEYWS